MSPWEVLRITLRGRSLHIFQAVSIGSRVLNLSGHGLNFLGKLAVIIPEKDQI